ncbi:chalcone isomerase [Antarcticibacterium flavum]|uniref:Chalcone isomerase n=1 Tax=Antarcticibacterium flavum TaxID=2058175 RepID=A0A5B7WYY3_9FLAO|nr:MULTISPECIES: chalcone isomerase family protein [Antarcticibacterium]MCM4161165.1 chalcone isomerase [Antarcticibacterium sp. W02-3]QCY68329.1 chalcone isomerase [Antarcticibacterium flavum]
MKKAFILFFAMAFIAVAPAQTKAGGATIPNTVSFEGEKLVLNGVGVREKFWMDMYAGALYLNNKSSNANTILNANEPMAIKLHIVSKLISSDKMIDAVNEGFENSTNGNITPIKPEIDKFISFFRDEITKDDVFDIVYLPSKGVIVYKNGNERGTIKGMEFKKALFGIWLSNNPADKKLKEGMLGKK